jgi:hypothetical protein
VARQPNPYPTEVAIGELRWPLVLYVRKQTPDPQSTSIVETLVSPVTGAAGSGLAVMGKVEPMGAMTFYAAVQVDTPLTHRITFRYVDGIDTTWLIQRITVNVDGTPRTESFRVRRVLEVDGRRRWIMVEGELEQIPVGYGV